MANAASNEAAIDGSSSEIHGHSRYYGDVAEAVRTTISNLRTVTSGINTRSDAVDAFVEIADKVRANLIEVEERYDTITEQLSIYANALSDLKSRAFTIQSLARNAEEAIGDKNWVYWREKDELDLMLYDDPARPAQQRYVDRLDRELDELRASVGTANDDLDALLDEWRRVADGCADKLKGVIEGSDLNDGFWDKLADWMENVLPDLEFWLDIIAIVLTVVAFVLVFTGVGAPLAAALFMVARAAQLVSKILKVVKILATLALVAVGKYPPSKMIDLAVGMAIDKVLGKVGEGVLDFAGKRVIGRYGPDLVYYASLMSGDAGDNMKKIVDQGFDAWTTDVFVPEIRDAGMPWEHPDIIPPGSTYDLISSAHKGLDATANVIAGGVVDMLAGTPGSLSSQMAFGSNVLDAISGPSTPLSNMAFKTVDFLVSDVGGFDWSGDLKEPFMSAPAPEQPRPSYDQLVST